VKRNWPARWSVLLGLLAAAVLPAAVAYAERGDEVRLIWAGLAVPVAFVLGLVALVVGRAGLRRSERSVARRGRRTARLGRFLGLLGVLLAGTGGLALAFYAFLSSRGS
jgi:hypothetical protein